MIFDNTSSGRINNKRDDIREEYEKINLNINPLVLIQFPNENQELITRVEEILEDLGKTYDNGLVAIWMANRKENIDNIAEFDSCVQYLLIKQAGFEHIKSPKVWLNGANWVFKEIIPL